MVDRTNNRVPQQLCVYFRVDPDKMTYIQKLELMYVYAKLTEWLNDTDIQRIIQEADQLRITLRIRGRRRSLYHIFVWCQAKAMKESGRYDTTTKQLPIRPKTERYY